VHNEIRPRESRGLANRNPHCPRAKTELATFTSDPRAFRLRRASPTVATSGSRSRYYGIREQVEPGSRTHAIISPPDPSELAYGPASGGRITSPIE